MLQCSCIHFKYAYKLLIMHFQHKWIRNLRGQRKRQPLFLHGRPKPSQIFWVSIKTDGIKNVNHAPNHTTKTMFFFLSSLKTALNGYLKMYILHLAVLGKQNAPSVFRSLEIEYIVLFNWGGKYRKTKKMFISVQNHHSKHLKGKNHSATGGSGGVDVTRQFCMATNRIHSITVFSENNEKYSNEN